MRGERRISSTFKDLPGGQVLGPTFDYTHRLLDFSLAAIGRTPGSKHRPRRPMPPTPCRASATSCSATGLIEPPPSRTDGEAAT
jgi:alpha-D-ribose 1-methylphosphonate 5-triphosphate synthase subunit PhnI